MLWGVDINCWDLQLSRNSENRFLKDKKITLKTLKWKVWWTESSK